MWSLLASARVTTPPGVVALVSILFAPLSHADAYFSCNNLDFDVQAQNDFSVTLEPEVTIEGSNKRSKVGKSLLKGGVLGLAAEVADLALSDGEDSQLRFLWDEIAGDDDLDGYEEGYYYSGKLGDFYRGYTLSEAWEKMIKFYSQNGSTKTFPFKVDSFGYEIYTGTFFKSKSDKENNRPMSGSIKKYPCSKSHNKDFCGSSPGDDTPTIFGNRQSDSVPDSVCYKTGPNSYGRLHIDRSKGKTHIQNVTKIDIDGDSYYEFEDVEIDNSTHKVTDQDFTTNKSSKDIDLDSDSGKSDGDDFPTDYAREKTLKDFLEAFEEREEGTPTYTHDQDKWEDKTGLNDLKDSLDYEIDLPDLISVPFLPENTCQHISIPWPTGLAWGSRNVPSAQGCQFVETKFKPVLGWFLYFGTMWFCYLRITRRHSGGAA